MGRMRWRVAIALVCGLAAPAGAAAPGSEGEARKLTATGHYALCRLKAEAAAAKRGGEPNYARCDAQLAERMKRYGRIMLRQLLGMRPDRSE